MTNDGAYTGHRGLYPEGLTSLARLLERGVEEGVYPGAVVAIARDGEIGFCHAVGRLYNDPPGAPAMPAGALFDLASVTKAVAGGTLVALAIEDGLLTLDDYVTDYVPELRGPGKAAIQVKHLVTHHSGIQSNPKLVHEHRTWDTLIDAYLTLPLVFQPGTTFHYSSINLLVVRLIIERVTGRPVDELLSERVFGRLKLADTMFNPPESERSRIPLTEFSELRGDYDWGVVNDKTAQLMGGVSLHAGLFSTASDLARFGDALLSDARTGDHRLLSRPAASLLLRTSLDDGRLKHGVCWRSNSVGAFGDLLGPGSLGHTGTTGTGMCLVPAERLTAVFLTNRVNPTRQNYKIDRFRPRVFNAVAAALKGA
jgi:serine-type D-Ala-D-Ala carboxypeptidase